MFCLWWCPRIGGGLKIIESSMESVDVDEVVGSGCVLLALLSLSSSASPEISVINVVGMSAAAAHSVPLSSLSLALLFAVAVVAADSQSFPARDAFIFDVQSEWMMLSSFSSSELLFFVVLLKTCCFAVSHVGLQKVNF